MYILFGPVFSFIDTYLYNVQFKVAAISYLQFNPRGLIFPFHRAGAAKEASMSGPLEMGAAMMTVTAMVMHQACGQSPSILL